jgi:hypothetical protein
MDNAYFEPRPAANKEVAMKYLALLILAPAAYATGAEIDVSATFREAVAVANIIEAPHVYVSGTRVIVP